MTISQETTHSPHNVISWAINPHLLCHLLHYLIKQKIRIHKHEPCVLITRQMRNETGSIPETDECFIGVDNGDLITHSISVNFQVVGCHSPPYMGVCG
jgi:hypothetical protein